MKRLPALIATAVCAALLVLVTGCGSSATRPATSTTKEGSARQNATYQEVGKKSSNTVEYTLTNCTDYQITAMAIQPVMTAKKDKTAEAAEWRRVKTAYPNNETIKNDESHDDLPDPPNEMDDGQTIANREVFRLHYAPNSKNNTAKAGTDDPSVVKTEAEEKAEAAGRTLFEIDLTTPKGVIIISDVDLNDFTTAELHCTADGIGYIAYVSGTTDEEVNTKETAESEDRDMVVADISKSGYTTIGSTGTSSGYSGHSSNDYSYGYSYGYSNDYSGDYSNNDSGDYSEGTDYDGDGDTDASQTGDYDNEEEDGYGGDGTSDEGAEGEYAEE